MIVKVSVLRCRLISLSRLAESLPGRCSLRRYVPSPKQLLLHLRPKCEDGEDILMDVYRATLLDLERKLFKPSSECLLIE